MGGFFGVPSSSSTSGGGGLAKLGARLAFASPAGGAVAAAPPGFSSAVGRLEVSLAGGNSTWVSLTAGVDGQLLVIANTDAANILILPALNFPGFGDLNIPPGGRALVYYDGTDLLWERTSP